MFHLYGHNSKVMGTTGIIVFSVVMLHLVAGFGYVMYKITVGMTLHQASIAHNYPS
jgi:hypothetical protein